MNNFVSDFNFVEKCATGFGMSALAVYVKDFYENGKMKWILVW